MLLYVGLTRTVNRKGVRSKDGIFQNIKIIRNMLVINALVTKLEYSSQSILCHTCFFWVQIWLVYSFKVHTPS